MSDRKNILKLNSENAGHLCVFFALFLAYFARSILAKLFFGSITLPLFYVLTYGCLIITIGLKFRRMNNYLPWLLAIGAVILFGMNKTGEFDALYGYSIVILLPLVVPDSLVYSKKWIKFIIVVTTFVAVGCIFGRLFPSLYRITILPLFKDNDYRSIMFVLNTVEGAQGGFVSQSGYASYFLCVGIGALYSFRNRFKSRTTPIMLAILFIIGLLITQKRTPLIVFFVAILFVYYIEGQEIERFKRFIYIVLAIIGSYIILSLLVSFGTNIAALEKIYDVLHGLISGNEINDTGRTQLYGQAILYFLQNPLFGIGWLNFKNLFILRSTHVHDIYLQLLCETGIVGFAIFMLFFVTNIVKTGRLIKKWSDMRDNIVFSWLRFSLYLQAFFLLFGITENPLYDTEDVMFYFLAVGISCVIGLSAVSNREK